MLFHRIIFDADTHMADWSLSLYRIGMKAAPTHTIPVCLFELQNEEDAFHDGSSDIFAGAGEVPGRHHAADLGQFSGGSRETWRARGMTPAYDDITDRCG